ncbi:hypothetical protein [Halanaerobacter jeridensis]|uniref:Uncharacterized protein n=1 Tax=Halanaerobacter jeridensis TaxID=706427 RepID=A0A939BNG3_9FIRM|nr:hypothetical protein [Halanaerobacter jeridensis]MBM7555442.1 hypothetical protein [Halanaerobacter jeridensis]
MKTGTQESTSKVKLVLGLAVVLIVLLLMANWIVGNIMEKRLAENIDKSLQDEAPKLNFDYKKIAVNPMLAQVTFKDGTVKYNDGEVLSNFKWDKSVYKGSYADLFNLVNNQPDTINKLHTLKTDFNNLKISGQIKGSNPFDFVFLFSQVGLNFNGTLLQEELENNPEKILNHNQKLKLSISDFEMDFPKFFEEILINSNLQEKLLNLNKLDLALDYNATNKVIEIKETVDSSHSSGELVGDVKLLGTDVSDIKGMQLDLESQGQFKVENLKWGQADKTGQYTINKIAGNSEFEIDRQLNFTDYVKNQNMILGESNYEVNLEGLKIQIAGSLKNKLTINPLVMMSGINISEIIVNNLNLAYQTNNRQIRIQKAKLNSSIVDADMKADLQFNNQYPELSKINDFKVKLSDFKGNLRRIFESIENRMGASLPREGDAIVLEMKGTFDQPQIKGVHY